MGANAGFKKNKKTRGQNKMISLLYLLRYTYEQRVILLVPDETSLPVNSSSVVLSGKQNFIIVLKN